MTYGVSNGHVTDENYAQNKANESE